MTMDAGVIAECCESQQNAGMASITVRNVPDEARDELAARAARSGRSLQEYLRSALIDMVSRPSVSDVVAQIRVDKLHDPVTLTVEQILSWRDEGRL